MEKEVKVKAIIDDAARSEIADEIANQLRQREIAEEKKRRIGEIVGKIAKRKIFDDKGNVIAKRREVIDEEKAAKIVDNNQDSKDNLRDKLKFNGKKLLMNVIKWALVSLVALGATIALVKTLNPAVLKFIPWFSKAITLGSVADTTLKISGAAATATAIGAGVITKKGLPVKALGIR